MRLMKGHTGMVVCCTESNQDPHVLATGSEDESVRLWDLRTSKAVRRLACPSPVAAIANGVQESEWLVACGPILVSFDLRATDKVLVSEYKTLLEATDDIGDLDVFASNTLASKGKDLSEQLLELSCKEAKGQYIVVDDDGFITVGIGNKVTWKKQSDSRNIISSARFLSKDLLVSGGFDNTLVFADAVKGTVFARFPMTAGIKTFNPPHVHAIDAYRRLDPNSHLFAAALGDGSVLFGDPFEAKRKNGGYNWEKLRQNMQRVEEVHLAGGNCARFIDEERLGSSGNDRTLAIIRRTPSSAPTVLSRLVLPQKPNSICFPGKLTGHVIVCDTDNDIKVIPF